MKTIMTLAIAFSNPAIGAPQESTAPPFPEACLGDGLQTHYETYSMTIALTLQRYVCSRIAPDTDPIFERLLATYRAKAPQCHAATLASPELAQAPGYLDGYVARYRNGDLPAAERERALRTCLAPVQTDAEREYERAPWNLFPPPSSEDTCGR